MAACALDFEPRATAALLVTEFVAACALNFEPRATAALLVTEFVAACALNIDTWLERGGYRVF